MEKRCNFTYPDYFTDNLAINRFRFLQDFYLQYISVNLFLKKRKTCTFRGKMVK